MINVTQPFLPPLEEFQKYLEKIWSNKRLTNNGEFHQELEKKLSELLGVKYVSLFANGTLALITALQALKIQGEVITTPYSFVATTHALWWNRIKPIFVDIEPRLFTLDPDKIEAAITPDTTAILPVHVYGYPCQIEKIQKIANKHKLKVIYDAAHTVGAKYNGKALASFGDLSILSFHATKLFHTFEGGAIISHSAEIKKHIDYLKNFGFENETTVVLPGINAKMNEVQAAMGLLNLNYLDEIINKRKDISNYYQNKLENVKGIKFPNLNTINNKNYAYYPILVNEEKYGNTRDELYNKLKENNIYARRYFYPLITDFEAYKLDNSNKKLPVAEYVSKHILCLPIYPDLTKNDQDKIIDIISR